MRSAGDALDDAIAFLRSDRFDMRFESDPLGFKLALELTLIFSYHVGERFLQLTHHLLFDLILLLPP